ncbi:MAG: 50S ribosomal protein L23 [Flammeovirgaceae bacterium]|nr:50S ribosomal protein L23 [Flammeovirgaceae bacterium]PDH50451.1 MAG: 50S ribosomal protein L23 [Rhodothermaeota bacterium MED-G16]|tara:strand:- start:1520 stop:1807 length:288 start_codon:yes stop_codon:yes gene_type:complete
MAILIKPILTEKATSSNDKGKFSFIVDTKANKVQVKKAVEKTYDVNVVSVNTINVLGKSVSKFTKTGIVSGRKPSYKKAIVQLKEGEFIDFYSQI